MWSRQTVGNPFGAVYQQGRPAWMHEGTLDAALLEGHDDLEVVGESHRQDSLWRVIGGRHRPEVRVRMDVYAMLLAEDGNPYDANAVSVWIDGLMVGYLPQDEAHRLRPGLLALQEREGKPIALQGVVVLWELSGAGEERQRRALRLIGGRSWRWLST